jgi:hypothetical protein
MLKFYLTSICVFCFFMLMGQRTVQFELKVMGTYAHQLTASTSLSTYRTFGFTQVSDSLWYRTNGHVTSNSAYKFTIKPGLELGVDMLILFHPKWQFVTGLGMQRMQFDRTSTTINSNRIIISTDTLTSSPFIPFEPCYYTNSFNDVGVTRDGQRYTITNLLIPAAIKYAASGRLSAQFGVRMSLPVHSLVEFEYITIERNENTIPHECTHVKKVSKDRSGADLAKIVLQLGCEARWQITDKFGMRFSTYQTVTNIHRARESMFQTGTNNAVPFSPVQIAIGLGMKF